MWAFYYFSCLYFFMVLDLTELRIRLDQVTEQIVSGLKDRSRFLVNRGVFTKEFFDGKTWVTYRLKREQGVDSEFGRYLYFDQHPIIFNVTELDAPKFRRKVPDAPVKKIDLDFSSQIIKAYEEVVTAICGAGENEDTYGATAKIDAGNILLLNERIIGLGEQVAFYKLEKNKGLLKLSNISEIKKNLINPKREKEVVASAVKIAKRYGIKNPKAVGVFMQKIIDLTTEAETEYILKSKKL
jgi:chorismate mutase